MNFFGKLRTAKFALQTLLAFNVFFILAGIWGFVNFFKDYSFGYGFLFFVGLGTLVCGVILPVYLLQKATEQVNDYKDRFQQESLQFFSHWLHEKSKSSEVYKSPLFWTDILLYGAQWTAQDSNTPLATMVKELAPAIREEIRREPIKKMRKARAKKKAA